MQNIFLKIIQHPSTQYNDLPSLPIRVNIHTLKPREGKYTMSNWPDWFQEALRQRFYQFELASERQASCLSEDKNLFTQMDEFKTNQNEDIQRLLSEWEEAVGYQLSQDKQSTYMKGVKVGIRLILPIIQPTVTR